MTQLVGIFGYPLAHSISPFFQQAAFDYYSLPVEYLAWPTPPDRLEGEVRKLRDAHYLGANVTVPHKERVTAYLNDVDPWARAVGAVNTIVKEDDRLVGYNTDSYGFIKSLKERGQFEPRDKRVLLLGAGGAARAAAFGLADEGIASLTIANRTFGRAQVLADEVRNQKVHVTATGMDEISLETACTDADLIVNCTSVGMSHGGNEGHSPLGGPIVPPTALLYDMVYNPPETPLMKQAKRAGARTLGGLSMLIYQGAAAFEHWTGKVAPVDVMLRAGEEALARITVAPQKGEAS